MKPDDFLPSAEVFLLRPDRVRSIAISVSVDMFVCLSACISQNPHEKIHQIFCTCSLWQWLGIPLRIMRYVICISGFVDNVMFSCNKWNKPESKTCFSSSLLGGGTGGDVCRLRLHLDVAENAENRLRPIKEGYGWFLKWSQPREWGGEERPGISVELI